MQEDGTASKKQSSSRIVHVSLKIAETAETTNFTSTYIFSRLLSLVYRRKQPSTYGNNFGIEHPEGPTSFLPNLGSMICEWYTLINENCFKKMDRKKVSIQKRFWQTCSTAMCYHLHTEFHWQVFHKEAMRGPKTLQQDWQVYLFFWTYSSALYTAS